MTGSNAVTRWTHLVAPPHPPPDPVDWEAVHRRLGTPLPSDYRSYIDTYGLGRINDLYWVLHPHGRPDRLDLADQWAAARDPANQQNLLTPPPHSLGQLPGGLLPCVDEDAGILYWHTDPPDPDRWTVVYRDEDGGSWLPYPLGLLPFLLAVFTGDLPELGYEAAGYLGPPIRFDRYPFTH
jgi:hypothetical protein